MAPEPEKKPEHELSSAELVKSYVISLVIAIPCLVATYFISHSSTALSFAAPLLDIVLFLSVANFVLIIVVDQMRAQTGSFTVPALLAACFIVLMLIIVVTIARFVPMFDYHWIFPLVAGVMIFKYLALFKEKNLALKFYLAVNILALAALGDLGDASKIVLPF